jgi:S1-C subfamily serine protease
LPKPPRPAPRYPQEIASLKREVIDRNRCVECHLISDYQAQDEESSGSLDKRRTLYPSPDLKTIGIYLDVPRGLAVARVEGAAAQAGMQADDLITAIDRTPVLTFGDLQYRFGQLDRNASQLNLTIERQGEPKRLKIRLPAEWWLTDTGFRYWTVEPMVYFTTQPLSPEQKRRLKLKDDGFAGEVTEVDPLGESLKLHTLKKGDLVYAVNGIETSKLTRRVELYIKLTMRAGESATLKLLRNNQPMEMTLKTYRQYFRKERTG